MNYKKTNNKNLKAKLYTNQIILWTYYNRNQN